MWRMKTLDDMRGRRLLSAEQHERISAWVANSDGPEAIMSMPADLWRALSLASLLMNIDADLMQPPHLGL
jgi:DNA-binding GntR family transcriptional regulator